MTYLLATLCVFVVILSYTCHLLLGLNNRQALAMRELVLTLEKPLAESQTSLLEYDAIVSQLGELFDHIGVELERSSHQIAAKDLKALGAILRSNRPCVDTKLDLSWAQERLGPLADRYGIKPVNGRPYGLRQLIRVAEEVIESTLKPAKACT